MSAELLELLLFGHRQNWLGVGILSRLPPTAHLLREQAPLAAVGAEFGGIEPGALRTTVILPAALQPSGSL